VLHRGEQHDQGCDGVRGAPRTESGHPGPHPGGNGNREGADRGRDPLPKPELPRSPDQRECAAIPRELIESELFGYEKGPSSGRAPQGRKGCGTGEGGTLFLDEIGDLTPEAQAKLLRFLEEGNITVWEERGSSRSGRGRSATNKNLRELIAKGLFGRTSTIGLAVARVDFLR